MNLLQLTFQKSNADGYLYCSVTEQNTNFSQWLNGLHPAQQMSIKGAREFDTLISLLQFLDHELCHEVPHFPYGKPIPIRVTDLKLKYLVSALFDLSQVVAYTNLSITSAVISFKSISPARPKTDSCTYNYSMNEIVSMIQSILPSPINFDVDEPPKKPRGKTYECAGCHGLYDKKDALKEAITSTGTKINLCVRCNFTKPCGACKFPEPGILLKTAIKINNEGKNQKFLVCGNCRKSPHIICASCHSYFNINEYDECPCRIREDFKNYIEAHNADVLSHYNKDSYCEELFGIEIETGTLNENRRLFKEIARSTKEIVQNNAILKYDSSIDWIDGSAKTQPNDYKGFEIVTRPMMYKNTVRFLKDFCKSRHPLLRSWEVGTCGLHIHASKACLHPIEIGKILLFVNDKKNRNFIKMIAKREDKKYAKFLTKKIMDYRNSTPGANGIPKEHYEAINTSKPYTIEFRIFRGTLNIQTIISYLQFVKSLIDFVRVTPKSDLTYKTYIEYLFSTEKSQFRELKERIKSENMKEINERGEI